MATPEQKVFEIVSTDPIGSEQFGTFDAEEQAVFEDAWDVLTKIHNRALFEHLFTDRHKTTLFNLAKVAKRTVFADAKFEGTDPVGGFGMRWVLPEDVFSQAADIVWDNTWTAGAAATRFMRNYIGSNAVDTTTFQADGSIILQDTQVDKWAIALWGVIDQDASGRIHGVMLSLNDRERAFQDIELQMRNSEEALADFGRFYWVPPTTRFKFGVQVKTGFGGAASLKPVGIAFISARRATQLATATRPVAA